MRIAVPDFFPGPKFSSLLQQIRHQRIRGKDILTLDLFNPALRRQLASLVDRRERLQPVLPAEDVILMAVPGRDVHHPGSRLRRHKFGASNHAFP